MLRMLLVSWAASGAQAFGPLLATSVPRKGMGANQDPYQN